MVVFSTLGWDGSTQSIDVVAAIVAKHTLEVVHEEGHEMSQLCSIWCLFHHPDIQRGWEMITTVVCKCELPSTGSKLSTL